MPVIAQGCKPKPVVATQAGQDSTPQTGTNEIDDEMNRLDPSSLNGAIAAAQQTRALPTSNAAAFLAATNGSGSGKHKYAGKNVSIAGTKGYITDKGLFKQWSDGNLMTNAGKYGCPASSTITALSGYNLPTNASSSLGNYNGNYGAYVGAKIDSSSDDPLFMGSGFATSWDNSESSLPACGNEGSNVQVVYPAKATGAAYRGTYNAIKSGETTYMTIQKDLSSPTYETCKRRAEDVGHSAFGLSSDKCYTAPTLYESTRGGIAYEVKRNVLYNGPTPARQFHFSMSGMLSLLSSEHDFDSWREGQKFTTSAGTFHPNSLYEFGRNGFSQQSNQVVKKCMYGLGGLLSEQPKGTYGSNCNSVRVPYLKSVYIGTW